MFNIKLKKLRKEERFEDKLTKSTLIEIENTFQHIEVNKKDYAYTILKNVFENYIKELFRIKNNITQDEILIKLKTFNIDSGTIKKTKFIIDFITSIEYNNIPYSKEEIYQLTEALKEVVEEIYTERIAHLMLNKENLSSLKKDVIEKKYLKNFAKLKNYYYKNKLISQKHIIKTTEYFEALPSNIKDKYSKDFHYYCRNLPYLLDLLHIAENSGDKHQDELHQIISKINKLFLKLDENEKKELYPRIINVINSDEQKLNMYLMMGYSYLHKKEIKKSLSIFQIINKHFDRMDNSKKSYYENVLNRFLQHIKNEIKKNAAS